MIAHQIKTENGMQSALVQAMSVIPREKFVPRQYARVAYMDASVCLGKGAVLLKPTAMARFLSAASFGVKDKVLYIGKDCGYGPALLGSMGFSVYILTEDRVHGEGMMDIFQELQIPSISLAIGPLAQGWKEEAPFDKIFLEGSIDFLPETLGKQLQQGGEMLCFMERPGYTPQATKWMRQGKKWESVPLFDGWAPALKQFQQEKDFVF